MHHCRTEGSHLTDANQGKCFSTAIMCSESLDWLCFVSMDASKLSSRAINFALSFSNFDSSEEIGKIIVSNQTDNEFLPNLYKHSSVINNFTHNPSECKLLDWWQHTDHLCETGFFFSITKEKLFINSVTVFFKNNPDFLFLNSAWKANSLLLL